MGLDMYLTADIHVPRPQAEQYYPGVPVGAFSAVIAALNLGEAIDADDWDGMTVKVPVGYWRKANSIHGYIVQKHADGVDECQPISLEREDLVALRALCQQVLADRLVTAEALLPPTKGFFFGGYEVDEWYEEDLKRTVEIVDRALADERFERFTYQASW